MMCILDWDWDDANIQDLEIQYYVQPERGIQRKHINLGLKLCNEKKPKDVKFDV